MLLLVQHIRLRARDGALGLDVEGAVHSVHACKERVRACALPVACEVHHPAMVTSHEAGVPRDRDFHRQGEREMWAASHRPTGESAIQSPA